MEPVSDARLFGYALLATILAFGAWITWGPSSDGAWILVGAVGVFSALFFLDGLVVSRRERN